MGVGPIPFTAIAFYVDRYALPQWSIAALMSIDAAWLTLVNKDG